MQTKKCLILTAEEARGILCNWYADMIVNDRANVLDHVRSGKMDQLIPNVAQMTDQEVANMVGELNAAEEWGVNAHVEKVLVDLGDNKNCNFSEVWDVENIDPKEREQRLGAGWTVTPQTWFKELSCSSVKT